MSNILKLELFIWRAASHYQLMFLKSKAKPQYFVVVVQLLSHVWLFVTPWTAARQVVLYHLPEFAKTHVHWVSDDIQPSALFYPLILLPSVFPSIKVFSKESALRIRWPKYWSFSFSISPSNEYSGLISFRFDWLDPFSWRDSQESSPAPQFKSISSLVLNLLYGPTLTPAHDYWKNHNFD